MTNVASDRYYVLKLSKGKHDLEIKQFETTEDLTIRIAEDRQVERTL